MRAMVVGATAGLGRALCEELCAKGYDLLIASSDEMDLKVLSKHLRIFYGVNVDFIKLDISKLNDFLDQWKHLDYEPDYLLFPIGISHIEDIGESSYQEIIQLVTTNMVAVMTIISFYIKNIAPKKNATIVGFGSIATIRARRLNIVYSASKKGLEYYFYSLKHKLDASNMIVHFYNLGYLNSQLSYGKKLLIKPSSPKDVARVVVKKLESRSNVFMFYPRFWVIIAVTLRIMPWFIFKRIKV